MLLSLPLKFNVLRTVRVFPSDSVNVAPLVGADILSLLKALAEILPVNVIDVPVAVPSTGVINEGLVNVGELLKTKLPVPVSSLIIVANC